MSLTRLPAPLATYLQPANDAVARPLSDKLGELVTARDFGAVGNGTTDDTAALQSMLDHLGTNGGTGLLGDGEYLITAGLTVNFPAKPFRFEGTGPASVIKQRTTSALTALSISTPVGVRLAHFRIDGGYSVTGFASHGISISNPTRTTVDDVDVYDCRNTGILMFVTVQDTYGDSFVTDCKVDGNNIGQNGILLEGLLRSGIVNCTARRMTTVGSPCYGLQLKNRCQHSYIIGGSVSECKGGVVLASDGAGAGDGPDHCLIRGVIAKDCLDAGIFGKSTNCSVEYAADMGASPSGGYALNVAGFNTGLHATVSIYNVLAGRTAMRVTSDDTSIRVPIISGGFGSYLLEISAGVNRCRTVVDDIIGSTLWRVQDYVLDSSGTTDNEILFMRDLPGNGLSSGGAHVRFSTPGKQNYLSFGHSNDAFTFRANGTDRYFFSPTQFQPNPDNAISLGQSGKRWTTVYAVTGTINTSDERAKVDIAPMLDQVLDVWSTVEWVSYKFIDAVEKKGANARIHFGLVAQRVKEAFEAAGLDAFSFGLLCYDEWVDDDGIEQNRYGIRYEEALALEAALTRRTLSRLQGGRN